MVDLSIFQKLLTPLGWFLTLGKTDAEYLRGELSDLLHHTGESVRSLIEIEQLLAGLDKPQFRAETFSELRLHCEYTYTGHEASRKSRSHCTDIRRDLRRISFKLAHLGRTEIGQWKALRKAFWELEHGDENFLERFETTLHRLDSELRAVDALLTAGNLDGAWKRFLDLRSDIRKDVESLRDVVGTLGKAEDHIRRVLT